MKYVGSKQRIARYIIQIITANRTPGQVYVEPFVGGGNLISRVSGPRIGGDSNRYVVALLKRVADGGGFPRISREEYAEIRTSPEKYDDWLVGFAGVCCSYSGKWWGGYAGVVNTKEGVRDYIDETIRNLKSQKFGLSGVHFVHAEYYDLDLPPRCIIYCDPPYKATVGYRDNQIDHGDYYHWLRRRKDEGHTIFASEYEMPSDFKVIWEQKVSSSLSANGKSGGAKASVERLFTL